MTEHEQDARRETDLLGPVDDEVIATLADEERRVVLYFLREHGSASLSELADVVTGWTRTERGVASPEDRDRVRAALHHVHLPKLESVGLVSYDADSQTVRPQSLSAPEAALLEWASELDAAGEPE